jgi:hypothetical protein
MRMIMVTVIALVPSLALAKNNLEAARHEMIASDYKDAEKLLKRSINDFYGDPSGALRPGVDAARAGALHRRAARVR